MNKLRRYKETFWGACGVFLVAYGTVVGPADLGDDHQAFGYGLLVIGTVALSYGFNPD